MFMMVDFVRKMTAKKSRRHGEYGSCEHLLFLFNDNTKSYFKSPEQSSDSSTMGIR